MSKIKVGIAGGAGYTGGELIRLLLNHPVVALSFVHSNSNAGNYIHSVHQDLVGETELRFTNVLNTDIDLLFLCLGHGESRKLLMANEWPEHVIIIDLSQDFRLSETAKIGDRTFVYGLPELNGPQISAAHNIANPGCFATAIQLALLPLAKAGLLRQVYATGITGSTGAGQSLSASSHFSWRANNISGYKTLQHQHIAEITQSFQQLHAQHKPDIYFVPWRGDFTRGIFVSATVDCSMGLEEVSLLYQSFYKTAAFTHVSDQMIDLKQVVNTNKCLLYLEKVDDKLVVHAAIDNLLKGACGQAVQNMNIMFGLAETEGLKLKANAF